MKRAIQVLLLLGGFYLSGCTSTTLPRTGIPTEIFELAAGNSTPVFLEVSLEESATSAASESGLVGHQYLFVAIPFGSVHLPSPAETITNSMYQKLVLRGLKPVTSKAHVFGPLARLNLSVTSLSVSAFDLVFTRKVTASLSGRATLFDSSGEKLWEMPLEGSDSELRRYGFSAELEHALSGALDGALNPVAEGTAGALKVRPRGAGS